MSTRGAPWENAQCGFNLLAARIPYTLFKFVRFFSFLCYSLPGQ